jgi:hypothetical protein
MIGVYSQIVLREMLKGVMQWGSRKNREIRARVLHNIGIPKKDKDIVSFLSGYPLLSW